MTVGNDVVDLEDPEAVGASRRERFVRRILLPAEARVVKDAADPDAALWAFFAAKEAAYKAAVRRLHRAPTAPRAYEVSADGESVLLPGLRLRVLVQAASPRSAAGGRFVHAVAWAGDRPAFGVGEARGAPGEDARSLLSESVASTLGWTSSELRIVRDPLAGSWDGYGPPRLERDGRRTNVCVSLSHHGRFVAYAHLR